MNPSPWVPTREAQVDLRVSKRRRDLVEEVAVGDREFHPVRDGSRLNSDYALNARSSAASLRATSEDMPPIV